MCTSENSLRLLREDRWEGMRLGSVGNSYKWVGEERMDVGPECEAKVSIREVT